jgi:hypothetical protein
MQLQVLNQDYNGELVKTTVLQGKAEIFPDCLVVEPKDHYSGYIDFNWDGDEGVEGVAPCTHTFIATDGMLKKLHVVNLEQFKDSSAGASYSCNRGTKLPISNGQTYSCSEGESMTVELSGDASGKPSSLFADIADVNVMKSDMMPHWWQYVITAGATSVVSIVTTCGVIYVAYWYKNHEHRPYVSIPSTIEPI